MRLTLDRRRMHSFTREWLNWRGTYALRAFTFTAEQWDTLFVTHIDSTTQQKNDFHFVSIRFSFCVWIMTKKTREEKSSTQNMRAIGRKTWFTCKVTLRLVRQIPCCCFCFVSRTQFKAINNTHEWRDMNQSVGWLAASPDANMKSISIFTLFCHFNQLRRIVLFHVSKLLWDT